MTRSRHYLTLPQITAAIAACEAMLAGEEGEGDFQCNGEDLARAAEWLKEERGRRLRASTKLRPAPEPEE